MTNKKVRIEFRTNNEVITILECTVKKTRKKDKASDIDIAQTIYNGIKYVETSLVNTDYDDIRISILNE